MRTAVWQRGVAGDPAEHMICPFLLPAATPSLETREPVVGAAAPSVRGKVKSEKTGGLLS